MGIDLRPAQALRLLHQTALDQAREDAPDLTLRQTAILLTIYLEPPPHTVRGLAAKLVVTKPVITRALDTMGGYGLVERRRDPADRRNVLIKRTVRAVFTFPRWPTGWSKKPENWHHDPRSPPQRLSPRPRRPAPRGPGRRRAISSTAGRSASRSRRAAAARSRGRTRRWKPRRCSARTSSSSRRRGGLVLGPAPGGRLCRLDADRPRSVRAATGRRTASPCRARCSSPVPTSSCRR